MTPPFEQLRHQLARELGHPPDGRIWKDIVNFHGSLLAKIEQGSAPFDRLELLYDSKEDTYGSRTRRPTSSGQARTLPADARLATLTRIAAIYATREGGEVRRIRDNLLGGTLLQPEDVPAWLRARAAEQEPQAQMDITFSAGDAGEWLPSGGERDWLRSFMQPATAAPPRIVSPVPLLWDREQCAAWLEGVAADIRGGRVEPPQHGQLAERLHFWSGGPDGFHRDFVPVGVAGPLRRLKDVLVGLLTIIPWPDEADAVDFVLAGQMPRVPRASMRAIYSHLPALSRLELTIDPRLSSRDVAAFYQRGRAEFIGGRDKPMQEKHLELALFCGEQLTGEPKWRELRSEWNERFPDWRYDDDDPMARRFARDARAAFKRVVGLDLSEARAAARTRSGLFMRSVGIMTEEQIGGTQ